MADVNPIVAAETMMEIRASSVCSLAIMRAYICMIDAGSGEQKLTCMGGYIDPMRFVNEILDCLHHNTNEGNEARHLDCRIDKSLVQLTDLESHAEYGDKYNSDEEDYRYDSDENDYNE